MYHNMDNAYRENVRHLNHLRKEAQVQRVLHSGSPGYRLRLARNLQRLANWLKPSVSKGDSYV